MRLFRILCPHCAASLSSKAGVVEGAVIPCPKCKKRFAAQSPDEENVFSPADEDDDDEEKETDAPPPPRRKKAGSSEDDIRPVKRRKKKKDESSNLPLLIGGGVLAAVLIVVGIVVATRDTSSNSNGQVQSTEQSSNQGNQKSTAVASNTNNANPRPPLIPETNSNPADPPTSIPIPVVKPPAANAFARYDGLAPYLPPQPVGLMGRDFEAMRKVGWLWKQYREFVTTEQKGVLAVLRAGGVSADDLKLELQCGNRMPTAVSSDPNPDSAQYQLISFTGKFNVDAFKAAMGAAERREGDAVYYTLTWRQPQSNNQFQIHQMAVYLPTPSVVVCAVASLKEPPFTKFKTIVAGTGERATFDDRTLELLADMSSGHVWEVIGGDAEQTTYAEKEIRLSKINIYRDEAEANSRKDFYSGIVREILSRAEDPAYRKKFQASRGAEIAEAILKAQREMVWEVRGRSLYMAQTMEAKPFENNFRAAIMYYK
jgi:hypothetical protein